MLAGMDPLVFWDMTPWQFRVFMRAANQRSREMHDAKAWFMWNGAVLNRWGDKKFPSLKKYLSGKKQKPVKNMDEKHIMGFFRTYERAYKDFEKHGTAENGRAKG